MRVALLMAVLAGWLAPVAWADPVVVRDVMPAAGPALAGDDLVWGEEAEDGTLTLLRGRAGEPPRVLMTVAPPPREDQRNYFGGIPGDLVASPQRIAFALGRDTCTREASDVVGCTGAVHPMVGDGDGPFERHAPACSVGGTYVSVAVQDDTVAAALDGTRCGGREGTAVWVRAGGLPPRELYRRPDLNGGIYQLRIAGRYIAWTEDARSGGSRRWLVVRDIVTNREYARIPGKRFVGGSGDYHGFDIDADGTIVATGGPQPFCYYACLYRMRLDDRRPRRISRRVYDTRQVAVSDGRVLFSTTRRREPHRLVVTDLDGKVLHTLDHLSRARRPVEELVLEGHRAAWGLSTSIEELSRQGEVVTATF